MYGTRGARESTKSVDGLAVFSVAHHSYPCVVVNHLQMLRTVVAFAAALSLKLANIIKEMALQVFRGTIQSCFPFLPFGEDGLTIDWFGRRVTSAYRHALYFGVVR